MSRGPPTIKLVPSKFESCSCGGSVIFIEGPRGWFRGCTSYPSCRKTEPLHDMDFIDLHLGFNRPLKERQRPDDPSDFDVQLFLDLTDP